MMNKKSGISIPVDQQFLWWNSSAGNNINSTQAREEGRAGREGRRKGGREGGREGRSMNSHVVHRPSG